MTINRDRLVQIALILIIVGLGWFAFHQMMKADSYKQRSDEYKQKMIEEKTLREVGKGEYKILVDDLNSQKDLNEALEDQNDSLYHRVVELENKKPVVITDIEYVYLPQIDTIEVDQFGSFVDFYPSKGKWYINYTSDVISDTQRKGSFAFQPIKLDLVVSEVEENLFEADFKGPDFIEINKLEVKTLPLENLNQDNFDWLIGGGLGRSWVTKSIEFKAEGGVRIKDYNYTLGVQTNDYLWLTVLKSF